MPSGIYERKPRERTEKRIKLEDNLVCVECGKTYNMPKGMRSLKYLRTRKFCSLECYRKSDNNKIGQFKIGHKDYNKKGKESHAWKGGLTPENKIIRKSIEFRLWRESVFARDNWTCQKCEEVGGTIHPHHIKGFAQYPELRFAIDNGITLCIDCHRLFHTIYGTKDINEEQIVEFCGNKLGI